jgi:hypothetical protein
MFRRGRSNPEAKTSSAHELVRIHEGLQGSFLYRRLKPPVPKKCHVSCGCLLVPPCLIAARLRSFIHNLLIYLLQTLKNDIEAFKLGLDKVALLT